MGLSQDLGYRHRAGNPAHRAARWVAGTRPGAWVFSRTLRHLDDAVSRLSGGRHSAPGLLAGLAVLELETTGRRSGLRRTTHLIAVPVDDTLALLGTNFGQGATPAWVRNLEHDPRARVSHRGTTREVVARPATPVETSRVLAVAGDVYPGYVKYRQRIGDRRRVRIFVLDPA